MVRMLDTEVREALDKVHSEESWALDEELMQMQLASLPKEDRRCVAEGNNLNGRNQDMDD